MTGLLRRLVSRAGRSAAVESPVDRPGAANPYWDELARARCGALFEQPGADDLAACRRIADAYAPTLAAYGIPLDEFFSGSIKEVDAAALHALVRTRRPQRCYQVGTFVGFSAFVIASALRDNGAGVLVCCDPEIPHRTFMNPVDVARDMAKSLGLEPYVRFERGWNALPIGDDFSHDWSRRIPVRGPDALRALGSVEFAFVDGDHSHAATVCDLMLIQQHLAVGGLAVFHDAKSWPSVSHALQAFRDDIYFYREGTKAFFRFDTFDGPDGLVAVERLRLPRKPLLGILVLAPDGVTPVAQAEVSLPGLGFAARTDRDGRVFHFGEASADARLVVRAPGFAEVDAPVGVATAGDYAECAVRLAAARAAV